MKDNKLIAEFMGIPNYKQGRYLMFEYADNNHRTEQDLAYHISWDWLMPVVEKIECTTIDNNDNSDNFFNVMIEVFECNINGGNICICESGNTKLEATYKAVVEFIKNFVSLEKE
jgi:hypothetical protein|tara:strand:- start:1037 stop:1381 length:345 start_codon:yes stop_codon:yes gene_type:complete